MRRIVVVLGQGILGILSGFTNTHVAEQQAVQGGDTVQYVQSRSRCARGDPSPTIWSALGAIMKAEKKKREEERQRAEGGKGDEFGQEGR